MGRVYRRKDLKPLPKHATVKTGRSGTQQATWVTRRQTFTFPVASCGTKYVREDRFYTVEYTPNTGGPSVREQTRYTDKSRAEQYLRKKEQEEEDKRNGVFDEDQHALLSFKGVPIEQHINAYIAFVAAEGRTSHHVQTVDRRLRLICQGGSIATLADLRLSNARAGIAAATSGGKRQLSDQTRNHYVTSFKSFVNWLVNDRRLTSNPVAQLKVGKVLTRKHERRVLSLEEIEWLLKATRSRSRPNQNISGPDRAVMYLLLMCIGYRRKELASLTPESFFDSDGELCVRLERAKSKNRKGAITAIPANQATGLRAWLAARPADQPLFRMPGKPTKLLRRDLALARNLWLNEAESKGEREEREASDFLKYRDSDGLYADLHSFRGVHATLALNTDAPLASKLKASRHSDPRVAGRYWKAADRDVAAVQHGVGEKLPAWIPEAEEASDPSSQCASQCVKPETHRDTSGHLETHNENDDVENPREKPHTPNETSLPKGHPLVSPTTGPFLFLRLRGHPWPPHGGSGK